ncbi:50S ribosomal protein L13 [Desulfurococcus mucosus]|uniref:Large ribosomal subunit protein uL13 n=1 Tax=Desulfurococcus mucosus (strain ATCC 35584 / DSM 2162 / JCM 9187 / O7/1) TaxID=765177 RepID=E8R7Q2_DESM0|nr:50S ribosomal protein L13 [Desulfurococcus mucosus]ADV65646.1 LSU ribosomal protein L13P [Desulfurococcus mucosus DSM 2162]
MSEEKILYVDASNQVLGRVASIVAKKLLEGYRVIVVNAEKAVVSGEKNRVIAGYKLLLNVKTHYNPEKTGIRRPRTPVNIFKRTVRGMLPVDQPKGREAYRRLRVYVGVPSSMKNVQFTQFPEASASRLRNRFVYLEEIARAMGWRGVRK